MKILLILKRGPKTMEAQRALEMAREMAALGHQVSLFLLQEGVHLARRVAGEPDSLWPEGLAVQVLAQDLSLRGFGPDWLRESVLLGSYESLVELIEKSDRVIGVL